MLTPEQIYRRARNRYAEFLRALCTGQPFFPLTVFGAGMAKPKVFAADRESIALLQNASKEVAGYGYEITWGERTFRRWGTQKVPQRVAFATQHDYFRTLNKLAEVRQFHADYDLIRSVCPGLEAWAQAKPLEVVAHAETWWQLLDVCIYLRANPCPRCYLRELPVIMDTKLVENHLHILAQLIPLVAPSTVTTDKTRFETRFGFRCKQPLIRIRFLDSDLAERLRFCVRDLATPLDEFAQLPLGGNNVLVVENEMTFLTLPTLSGTIAIHGSGDAAALLGQIMWLRSCRILYWGDLDSHGFEALSTLRSHFPDAASILMDEQTLAGLRAFAVQAAATRNKMRLNLTTEEQALYDRLVDAGIQLEQERIPNAYSQPRLARTFSAVSHP